MGNVWLIDGAKDGGAVAACADAEERMVTEHIPTGCPDECPVSHRAATQLREGRHIPLPKCSGSSVQPGCENRRANQESPRTFKDRTARHGHQKHSEADHSRD